MPAPLTGRRRWRMAAAAAAVASTAVALLATAPPVAAQAQQNCLAAELATTTWATGPDTGGFATTITLTNNCPGGVQGWELNLSLAPGHELTHGWSAAWSSAGKEVTAAALPWNEQVAPGESITIGFTGRYTGAYQDPLSCMINGAPCGGGPGENQPPEVTLASPTADFATPLTCPVPLAADAVDPDGTVARVEFYVNDQLVATDDEAPYELEYGPSGVLRMGENVAFARAVDDGDPALSTDTDLVTFQMTPPPPAPGDCDSPLPPVPPDVGVVSPADGEVFTSSCAVPLAVLAADADGTVVRVEFYVNDQLVGTDDEAPYELELAGDHPAVVFPDNTFHALAFDDDGETGISPPVTFSKAPLPPALMLISCTNPVELVEGDSEVVNLRNLCASEPLVELSVTGDPGISVSPTSFTFIEPGQDITISAAAGTAGATAQVRAVPDAGCLPANIQVDVAGG